MKVVLKWSKPSPPKRTGQSRVEMRNCRRLKIKSTVTLSWLDLSGYTWTVRARSVDMSKSGARLESPEPLPPGSIAFVRVQDLKLMGDATVRYCVKRGLQYAIGLQFRSPLTRIAEQRMAS